MKQRTGPMNSLEEEYTNIEHLQEVGNEKEV